MLCYTEILRDYYLKTNVHFSALIQNYIVTLPLLHRRRMCNEMQMGHCRQ